MWRRGTQSLEIEAIRDDVARIPFDIRSDVDTIRRHVLEEDDGEEEEDDA